MKKYRFARVVITFAAVTGVILASTAYSSGDSFRRKVDARLSGAQEVPSISTNGEGEFEAFLSDDRINFELSYEELEGTPVMAHLHIGQRGVNGGIFAFLCGGAGKPPCPPAPARIEGTILPSDILAVPTQGLPAGNMAEALRAIRLGITYANVHTTSFPTGEIRGQLGPDFGLRD